MATPSRALISSSVVLQHYRELLELIGRMPEATQREAALQQARHEIRANRELTNPMEVTDKLKELVAKVSFLRMTTPKGLSRRRTSNAGSFVLRDGELVNARGASKGSRVADGTISWAEAHEYHNRLLKRQHFGREPPKGPRVF